jgi:hypothetical protein
LHDVRGDNSAICSVVFGAVVTVPLLFAVATVAERSAIRNQEFHLTGLGTGVLLPASLLETLVFRFQKALQRRSLLGAGTGGKLRLEARLTFSRAMNSCMGVCPENPERGL